MQLIIPAVRNIWRPMLMASLARRTSHLVKKDGHLSKCGAGFLICCDQDSPTEVTLAGATGCNSIANGTFALTPVDGLPCHLIYSENFDHSIEPCTTHCGTTIEFGTTWYWKVAGMSIGVIKSAADNSIEVGVTVNFARYFIALDTGICTESIPNDKYSLGRYSRDSCLSGEFTLVDFVEVATGGLVTSVALGYT